MNELDNVKLVLQCRGNGLGEKVIFPKLFGFEDVTDIRMIVEKGQFIGADVWYKTCKVVGFRGRDRVPMFKENIRKDTIYFCEMVA